MGIQNLLVFLFLSIVHASNDCPTSYCNKTLVHFPFWLQGTQSPNCAPPGFNWSCNGQRYPILHIPGSGNFYVSSIYYDIRRVTLEDVQGCLPGRLLSFNLSSTPFVAIQYVNYTFFRCPKGQMTSGSAVECTSNATSDIFAMRNQTDSMGSFSRCNKISTVQVPVSPDYDLGFPVDLDLTWDVDDCQDCPPATGGTKKRSNAGRIALTSIITSLYLLIIIACVVNIIKQRLGDHQNSNLIEISEVDVVTGRGLDKSTIESYRTITIGESCAQIPNGVTCAICLADYAHGETLRFNPQCEHCFHIECTDKWLTISRKCPICRIYLPNTISTVQ